MYKQNSDYVFVFILILKIPGLDLKQMLTNDVFYVQNKFADRNSAWRSFTLYFAYISSTDTYFVDYQKCTDKHCKQKERKN